MIKGQTPFVSTGFNTFMYILCSPWHILYYKAIRGHLNEIYNDVFTLIKDFRLFYRMHDSVLLWYYVGK